MASPHWFRALRLALLAGVLLAGEASAQPAPAGTTPPRPDDEFVTDSSDVGYIDPAIPRTTLRFRYDAAFDNPVPNRSEFFYAGPSRGTQVPERSADYQELQAYVEAAVSPNFSAFFEVPFRFIDPEVNDSAGGFSDINAGVKYAFIHDECRTATFQFRAYAPTGSASSLLGNGHTSLEPALLFYREWTDRFRTEAELRTWVPVGGTDFAGPALRYGVGASYTAYCGSCVQIAPVVEFVNWTFLGGRKTEFTGTDTPVVSSATGDHVLNVKLGSRLRFNDHFDLYAGYGRPLTGDTFYNDIVRFELRFRY
jgi:hypothetical protein